MMEKIQWILWQEPQDRAGLHSRLVNIHLRNSSREVGSDNRARDASVSRAPVKFSISFTLIMLIYSKLQILHYLPLPQRLQVLPPIERLREPIEGMDRFRLAECHGMCLTLYKNLED